MVDNCTVLRILLSYLLYFLVCLFFTGAHSGGMAFLCHQNRFIYYLVTKEQYFKKPSMKTLESSLQLMRQHCLHNHVQYVAMPTIGCGLDKLDWYDVRELLVKIFRDTPVEITVYMV